MAVMHRWNRLLRRDRKSRGFVGRLLNETKINSFKSKRHAFFVKEKQKRRI